MYMNTQHHKLKFEYKQLLVQMMQQYYSNNEIKISAHNNNKLTALSTDQLN